MATLEDRVLNTIADNWARWYSKNDERGIPHRARLIKKASEDVDKMSPLQLLTAISEALENEIT